MELTLSEKQEIARDLLNDPQVVEIYYGGAAGGGKSMLVCLWMLEQIRRYPGIRIGLGRKELTRLKQTTVLTLLTKAHPLMNIKPKSFNYQDQKGLITYRNGSSIQLFDLIYQPSDPDYDTLGSLELTHAVIEESGELIKKAKTALSSRKNRHLNKEYGIVGKTVLTGNPSQNFTYSEYYEPYKNLGMGDYKMWEFRKVTIKGVEMPGYRAFIKSLVTDNPFADPNYIAELNSMPVQERKRLRDGNWDYMDDDDMLFKPQLLDKASTSESKEGVKYIGVDVSDKGKDKTIACLIEDGIVTKQRYIGYVEGNPTPISEQLSLGLIQFAQMEGFTAADARRIAIEGNGVGVGMRDFMRSKGWGITEYTATSQTRSKAYYDTSQDMDKGELQILNSLNTITEVRKQLMAHTYEVDEQLRPKVLKKDKIKEILGKSPDEADSLVIANWCRRGGNVSTGAKIIF